MRPGLNNGSRNELPPAAPETTEHQPPVILPSRPDYEILRQIGRGGYGEVYLARDNQGHYWAVKVVYRVSFDDDEPYEREYRGILKFEPVSRANQSQLQVLHVARRDYAGYFYYIMEAADDENHGRDIQPETYSPRTLKSELARSQRLSAEESCRVAWMLAAALENLHKNGLVHRDIKPANVIFSNGHPKLADVGLVTHADMTISCAGTEGYIPPEGPGSFRADIYSLGKLLYEMFSGCDRRDFPNLPENFCSLPDHDQLIGLNRIATKACEINPRKRYQSAHAMRTDLETVLHGKSLRSRANFNLIALLAIIAVLLSVTVVYFSRSGRDSVPKPVVLNLSLYIQGTAHVTIDDSRMVIDGANMIRGLRLNRFEIGESRRGEKVVIENRGSTLFLPEKVQFASVQIVKSSNDKRRSKVMVTDSSDDRIGLRLLPGPTGSAYFDLTIRFNASPITPPP